jgi:hypothetical protein
MRRIAIAQTYPLYFAALGDMELRCQRHEAARLHFRTPWRSREVPPNALSSSVASARAR